ncbi:von Willebrand factor C domain-containing protein 2-like [Branchiostoma floridae]|uniref:von Willebrand factor C domain-containing protein 2-like n=1 Tax=Branchiostoma floridae TaxID=7739 RepID=A0A9J7MQK8_BRAFL|nr:von Willebrand factor C domain-containing protein 2-like [Branchiostoma floridae]
MTTTTTTMGPTVYGCRGADGQIHPPGSTYGSSCHPCQCANEPTLSGTTWVYTQWCLHIDCGCPRCVDYVFSPDQCCPTCPNGDNCDAMGTVIPGGMDVQVYGTTCRCAYYGFFLAPVVPVQSAIQSLQQLCRLL